MKSPKNRTTALLLLLFLGGFGAHNFYVGRTGRGILMLILTITLILSIITFILWLIDLIKICSGTYQDKDKLPLTEW